MKSYHFGDVFTINSTEYTPIPMPIPPSEYANCSFTILMWNEHETATINIQYGDMHIQLPPSTSIVLDFQPIELISKGVYAKINKPGEIVDLQVIITGMEIPVYAVNMNMNTQPTPSPMPIQTPSKKIYVLGLVKTEGD